jgi:hypothetical protein
LADDEYPSNPYVAPSCGSEFETFEEMQHHERKHRAALARREATP